jgi:hypothetical protein
MTAEEIRKIEISGEFFGGQRINTTSVITIVLLREIAAQLAELNLNLRVKTSLDSGGGYPED